MILSLEFYRSPLRHLGARLAAGRAGGTLSGAVLPLRLAMRAEPQPPGTGWVRVRPLLSGICGSDLAALSGRSSMYLSPLVSMPFVPGHEVVGEVLDGVDGLPAGTRVVLDPLLTCHPRATGPCRWCAEGQPSRCDHVTVGSVAPGLQIGYCADTGGGWSRRLTAHHTQLLPVPDALSDAAALLTEPLACAVRSVRRARVLPGDLVTVVGAGSVGILTLIALRALAQPGPVVVVAKHPRQREVAAALGATDVVTPRQAGRVLRRATGGFLLRPETGGDYLVGGADVAFECTGGGAGLDLALRTVRAGARVVLSGMPTSGVDLTPLWYRELELVGSYGSGSAPGAGSAADFAVATELLTHTPLDTMVEAVYPLSRWREALDHAFSAGRLGTFKVAFDPNRD
jgi:threonine dehydrogenase-like Zn-dependent dehydrogenase